MKAWTAEFLGTFFLVMAGSAAAQMAINETFNIRLLVGAISVGAVLFVFITLFGKVSGAHFNPAVSLAFRLKGQINNRELVVYMLMQFAGAIVAAFSVHVMFALPFFQIADPMPITFGLGFSELLITSGLIFIIFFAISQNSTQIPAMVALYVVAGYFMSSSTVIANPAVTVARFLTDVPTTIGMPKAFYYIVIQFLAAPLVIWKLSWLEKQSS